VDDPEEMLDLSARKPAITAELLSEVQDNLERSNAALPCSRHLSRDPILGYESA